MSSSGGSGGGAKKVDMEDKKREPVRIIRGQLFCFDIRVVFFFFLGSGYH